MAYSRPGPRVLAPVIILPLFGSGYLCWTVCFHAFHSSAVSWPDTQLSIWAVRPCTLDAYAHIRCVPSFANASMYANACVRVRVCMHACMQLCLFAPLYMHSDSQPYQCQRSAPGTPCRLLLWQTHLWSACSLRGQGWHNAWCQHKNCRKNRPVPSTLCTRPVEGSAAFGSMNAKGTTPLFWSRALGGYRVWCSWKIVV